MEETRKMMTQSIKEWIPEDAVNDARKFLFRMIEAQQLSRGSDRYFREK